MAGPIIEELGPEIEDAPPLYFAQSKARGHPVGAHTRSVMIAMAHSPLIPPPAVIEEAAAADAAEAATALAKPAPKAMPFALAKQLAKARAFAKAAKARAKAKASPKRRLRGKQPQPPAYKK